MKVKSFIRVGHELEIAEVEVTLTPGLPQFQFIGLPDASLKESALRIRAALREQGFELPQAQQILVHIKPTYLKKKSRGLDLAVACAMLWETNQLTQPKATPIIYGELTLKGEVVQPDDLIEAPELSEPVITGSSRMRLPFETVQIDCLAEMIESKAPTPSSEDSDFTRPPLKIKALPSEAALVAKVVAAGEHSVLLAGPPGTGKSTLAHALASFIEAPTFETIKEVRHYWSSRNERLTWRPVLRPHHSITPLAMIGGGASLWPGEITRAHGGVLIMDELLEFHSEIQEALREPVESGSISLVRASASRTYPARVLLVATTNLCECGNFVPRKMTACKCPKGVRRRVLTRLRGPFADRFAVMALTDKWEESTVPVTDIANDVANAIEFRRARGQSVPNSRLLSEVIEESLNRFQRDHLVKTTARSRRRRAALVQVARTLADLRGALTITNDDIEQARVLTVHTHRMMEDVSD